MVTTNLASDRMTTIAIFEENAQFLKILKRKMSVKADDDLGVNDIVALLCATCDVDKMVKTWSENKGKVEDIKTFLFEEQSKIANAIICDKV